MRRITRYDLPVSPVATLFMDRTGRILGLDGHIDGKPVLWAEENPFLSKGNRYFESVAPLWPVPENSIGYIGRYLLDFVTYNLYEVLPKSEIMTDELGSVHPALDAV